MPTLATNKQARAAYHILETFEAGIVLSGPEVKSVKAGQVNLRGSYVSMSQNNEAVLVDAHIAPYKPAKANQRYYRPTRARKLLLNHKELDLLRGKEREKGLTILPLSVYTKGSLIKIEVAIARGKKQFDKRESLKRRQIDRDIRRAMRRK